MTELWTQLRGVLLVWHTQSPHQQCKKIKQPGKMTHTCILDTWEVERNQILIQDQLDEYLKHTLPIATNKKNLGKHK
jgi:hypothetical protein